MEHLERENGRGGGERKRAPQTRRLIVDPGAEEASGAGGEGAVFVTEITVLDPDTHAEVALEVWKDTESGALFAVEATFLDQITESVPSPYNPGTVLELREGALPGNSQ